MVSFVVLSQTTVLAQPYAVEAGVSNLEPSPREEITITLSLSDSVDFYYAGLEVSYPTDAMEFVAMDTAGLSYGGIMTYGEVAQGTMGVSVSRVSPLTEPLNGPFMRLVFRVLAGAYAGTESVTFANQEIFDSDGSELEGTAPGDLTLTLQEEVSDATLTIAEENLTTEGEDFFVTGEIFATGITDTSRIAVWAGVSSSDGDPSTWDASAWEEMEFVDASSSEWLSYTREIAYMRPLGTWYVALRAQLDDGSYVYGGCHGPWDTDTSGNARLTISERLPYRYTLALYDFDNATLTPTASTPENSSTPLQLEGATFDGYSSGASGLAANSNGWNGDSQDDRYWSVAVNTEGFIDLQVSSLQYGSGTGPRDFVLETGTDGVTWTAAMADTIRAATNWSDGAAQNLALPASLDNQPQVYLRWRMASDSSIGGGTVSSSGTSRLDEVLITGINPSPQELSVYPGDANNDGQVNADDVLPLGTYWMHIGPTPVYNSLAFAPRTVETWIPAAATYADTRGDGRVDHQDLMPVGLHFGRSAGGGKKSYGQPLAQMVIDRQPSGTAVPLAIEVPSGLYLRGVSFSVSVSGVGPDGWHIGNLEPVFCPSPLQSQLLTFDIHQERHYEAAFALKGTGEICRTARLVSFDLVADSDWQQPVTVSLERVTVSNDVSGSEPVSFPQLLATGTSPEVGEPAFRVLPNRPNPFAGITELSYELPEATHVRLEVMNTVGKVVATLVDRVQPAGFHSVYFDGSALPPGIYFCRLTTSSGQVQTIKMTLMK